MTQADALWPLLGINWPLMKKPQHTRAYANLVHRLNELKRFDDAIKQGKKGIGTASERQCLHLCSLQNGIAKALEGRKSIDLAIKRYRLAEGSAKNAKDAAQKPLTAANRDSWKTKRTQHNLDGANTYLRTHRAAINRLEGRNSQAQ